MSIYQDNINKLRSLADLRDERYSKARRHGVILAKPPVELEKRVRREIANCNERRRMQSINTGFDALKSLLPTHDGDKLSKAAILQLTTKFITNLVSENRRLSNQLSTLRQIALNAPINSSGISLSPSVEVNQGVSRKRKINSNALRVDNEHHIPTVEELLHENTVLKFSLTEERCQREKIETQIKSLRHNNLSDEISVKMRPLESALLKRSKPDYEEYAFEQCASNELEPSLCCPSTRAEEDVNMNLANSGSLDHLVMAIEQIEGKFSCNGRQPSGPSSVVSTTQIASLTIPMLDVDEDTDKLSTVSASGVQTMVCPFTPIMAELPLLTSESEVPVQSVISRTSNRDTFKSGCVESAKHNVFAGHIMLVDDKKPQADYPIVSKLLKRPIPHKYLHRSHVIVNSSH